MSGGAKAARTGANFRAQIKTTLECNGFRETTMMGSYLDGLEVSQSLFGRNVVIGVDVYGNQFRADFVYVRGRTVRVIHARWQQASGSVDQKFPFFAANAMTLPYSSIFVLGGDGFKTGAREWLKQQKGRKIIEVFTEEEFQEWMNNGNY